ncbi:hypothetical protein BT96DRAFT_969859 [Gymnopus androsaceus JB14]|uniref:Uncharacterized protein n=1 Tax=Gymnopus androsaceus JB14 TaxID=1447944 RepID=A0A6A4IHS3_9AGAR|nr:hypothetical protein BT96DRAFT_969859 [Gymnopus androsaceus JB14]
MRRMKLFGDGPRNGDTVVYYIHNNLCKRWLLVDPSVSQQNPKNFLSPKCLRWKPLHESSPLHEPLPPYPLSKKYVVVYLTSNRYPDEMKFFEDHREEVIRISLEVTRLSPEKREELKWHRVNHYFEYKELVDKEEEEEIDISADWGAFLVWVPLLPWKYSRKCGMSWFGLVFPPTLDVNSPPPVKGTIHKNQITPKYFLGWVLPQHEMMKFFGDGTCNGEPVTSYIHNNICKWWLLVESSVLQKNPKDFPSPKCLPWKPLDEPLPPHPLSETYVVVYLTSNQYPNKMKFFEDHREEVIRLSSEVIGLSPEKREELKWHHVK